MDEKVPLVIPEVNPEAMENIELGMGLNQDFSDSVELPRDQLLGGLLTAGFDERSCLSGICQACMAKDYRESLLLI
ncbi:hypothetical protein K1719_004841 [Acacia pycnantha]|nr:hypothetical protein K1719_004841 [Acacia pycnantha]